MLLLMRRDASPEAVTRVLDALEELGLRGQPIRGEDRTVVGLVGEVGEIPRERLLSLPGVEDVVLGDRGARLSARSARSGTTTVDVGSHRIGDGGVTVIAGPCAVESAAVMSAISACVARSGGHMLRGGAYKPRTSPYSFQGLGAPGLDILCDAGRRAGLPTVTEAMAPDEVERIGAKSDMIQIGARNMQNFRLLETLGRTGKPVLLKRGVMATIDELLWAAEYILLGGNTQVVLCERGIRTFERYTRNTLDLAAVPLLKRLTHLPVIVDPSHATGDRELVPPMALAAIAAGADGVMIEIHPDPDQARSDGAETIHLNVFENLMRDISKLSNALGRSLTTEGNISTTL